MLAFPFWWRPTEWEEQMQKNTWRLNFSTSIGSPGRGLSWMQRPWDNPTGWNQEEARSHIWMPDFQEDPQMHQKEMIRRESRQGKKGDQRLRLRWKRKSRWQVEFRLWAIHHLHHYRRKLYPYHSNRMIHNLNSTKNLLLHHSDWGQRMSRFLRRRQNVRRSLTQSLMQFWMMDLIPLQPTQRTSGGRSLAELWWIQIAWILDWGREELQRMRETGRGAQCQEHTWCWPRSLSASLPRGKEKPTAMRSTTQGRQRRCRGSWMRAGPRNGEIGWSTRPFVFPLKMRLQRWSQEAAIPYPWDGWTSIRMRSFGCLEDLRYQRSLRAGWDLEKESFRTDCPTASNTAINILLSYAANKELELHSGDITAAFLQGAPIERTLLLSAPKDGIPVEGGDNIPPLSKLVALMSVYGSKDAPRGFWLELRGELLKQGLVEVDPAFYALVCEGQTQGLPCSHVDDLLWTGGELMDELMKKVQERFTFGSTEHGSFRFCGRKIEEKEDRYVVTCPESLGKVKPIHIDGGRQRDPNDAVSAEEQSQMRAVLGSLGWVARLCRPELCYMCSNLQGRQAKPIVDDLVRTNKLLASAQRTSTNGIVFMKKHFDFDGSVLISMTDASHAAELCVAENGQKQGHRSQGGRFLLLGDKVPDLGHEARCHIIEWQSQTLKRVCRSTLQAEVLSSMTGSEAGQQVRALLYSLVQPRGLEDRGFQWKIDAADSKLLAWMSDCRSYIEYMSSLAPGTVSDKRLAIDMTCLRQELWRRPKEEVGDPSTGQSMPIDAKDQLFWMSTADMTADQLTKAMKWDAVRGLCDTNLLKLTTRVVRAGLQSIKEWWVWEYHIHAHGYEVMHAPLTLLPKGPLSQCLQKVCHVDGLQLVLTNSFLKSPICTLDTVCNSSASLQKLGECSKLLSHLFDNNRAQVTRLSQYTGPHWFLRNHGSSLVKLKPLRYPTLGETLYIASNRLRMISEVHGVDWTWPLILMGAYKLSDQAQSGCQAFALRSCRLVRTGPVRRSLWEWNGHVWWHAPLRKIVEKKKASRRPWQPEDLEGCVKKFQGMILGDAQNEFAWICNVFKVLKNDNVHRVQDTEILWAPLKQPASLWILRMIPQLS